MKKLLVTLASTVLVASVYAQAPASTATNPAASTKATTVAQPAEKAEKAQTSTAKPVVAKKHHDAKKTQH